MNFREFLLNLLNLVTRWCTRCRTVGDPVCTRYRTVGDPVGQCRTRQCTRCGPVSGPGSVPGGVSGVGYGGTGGVSGVDCGGTRTVCTVSLLCHDVRALPHYPGTHTTTPLPVLYVCSATSSATLLQWFTRLLFVTKSTSTNMLISDLY